MTGPRDTARGAKGLAKKSASTKASDENLAQIEYLLFQSTQGIHFMFANSDVARILKKSNRLGDEEEELFTLANMEKVQGLLNRFLDCPSMNEKQTFIERLPQEEFELLVRAYFQLVENTILAHSDFTH